MNFNFSASSAPSVVKYLLIVREIRPSLARPRLSAGENSPALHSPFGDEGCKFVAMTARSSEICVICGPFSAKQTQFARPPNERMPLIDKVL